MSTESQTIEYKSEYTKESSAVLEELIPRLEKVEGEVKGDPESAKEIEYIRGVISSFVKNLSCTEIILETPDKLLEKIDVLTTRAMSEKLSDEEIDSVLDALMKLSELADDKNTSEILEKALDEYHTFTQTLGFDPLLCELLQNKVEGLLSCAVWKKTQGENLKKQTLEKDLLFEKTKENDKKSEISARENSKSIQVSEGSIEKFLSYVGELVEIGEMFGHLQRRVMEDSVNRAIVSDFHRINENLGDLSTNLQKSVMEIRKISIKTILQRVPKTVLDAAANLGKDIGIEIKGENIEVDKSIIDTFEGPLLHIVNNAVKYGIEPVDEREKAGKNVKGKIKVEATENANDITLEVSDDGRGIGEEVTDIPSRKIKASIESLGGKVAFSNEPEKGFSISLSLPKSITTKIIDGFIISVGTAHYVLPLRRIQESFRPSSEDIKSITGKGECVLRHDKVLPFVRLAEVFGCSEGSSVTLAGNDGKGIMVAINSDSKEKAIYVDDIIGVQQVVIKKLGGLKTNSKLFSGGSVMGDGRVAMVLDLDSLC